MTSSSPAIEASGRPAGLRIAMALYGDITYDSRVMREAEILSRAGHVVTIYCLAGSPPDGAPYRVVAHTPIGSSVLPDGSSPFLAPAVRSRLKRIVDRVRWLAGYARTLRRWGRWVAAASGEVDVWHVHDLTGLVAVAPLVRAPSRLIYDSHEIFLETGTGVRLPRPIRGTIAAYEGRLARRAEAVITVNEGCAEVLQARLRVPRMVVVRNCPPAWTPPGSPSRLRTGAGIPSSSPVILYHGAFMANRGIEEVTDAILASGLEDVHLVLLGYGPLGPRLADLALERRFDGRLHVLGAVPPGELLSWVVGADIDVIPIQHSTLNHWLGTPNRLWESLAAGVPVVVSDFPVMRRVVLDDPDGPLGTTCDPASPASIAAAIQSILELTEADRSALRARCLRAAHERWNWEREGARLLEVYDGIRRAGSPRVTTIDRARS